MKEFLYYYNPSLNKIYLILLIYYFLSSLTPCSAMWTTSHLAHPPLRVLRSPSWRISWRHRLCKRARLWVNLCWCGSSSSRRPMRASRRR